jgi:hypothetical protein
MRRAVLFGAPVGYIMLGLVHPPDPEVGDSTTLWLVIHLVQLPLICLVAFALWLLVDGLPGRAARVARAAVVPYAVFYAAFDTLAGLGAGIFIREANDFPAANRAVADGIWDAVQENAVGYVIYFAAAAAWLVAALAVAVALWRHAPRGVPILFGLGAAIFAVAHPQPPGPIGMALILVAIGWYELRVRVRAQAPQAPAVPLAP